MFPYSLITCIWYKIATAFTGEKRFLKSTSAITVCLSDCVFPSFFTRYFSKIKDWHTECMVLHVVHCSLFSSKQWEYIITRFVSISQWHFHLFDNAKKIVLQYSAISDIYLLALALLSNTKYTNFSKQKLDCCVHSAFTLTNWICQ